ncbi:MAG: hypothetical protein J5875_07595 [Paludibacteraceae bacterium]|nr:hypothetical protein [Paludibacteraceae bacterium]
MLKRFAAHWLVVDAENAIPCAVVSIDERGVVAEIFRLADFTCEPSGTTFVDGFIAPFLSDTTNVAPKDLKAFLLDCAGRLDASIIVGSCTRLFNYSVSQEGKIVVTPINDFITIK